MGFTACRQSLIISSLPCTHKTAPDGQQWGFALSAHLYLLLGHFLGSAHLLYHQPSLSFGFFLHPKAHSSIKQALCAHGEVKLFWLWVPLEEHGCALTPLPPRLLAGKCSLSLQLRSGSSFLLWGTHIHPAHRAFSRNPGSPLKISSHSLQKEPQSCSTLHASYHCPPLGGLGMLGHSGHICFAEP